MRYLRNPITGIVCMVTTDQAIMLARYGWEWVDMETYKAYVVQQLTEGLFQ